MGASTADPLAGDPLAEENQDKCRATRGKAGKCKPLRPPNATLGSDELDLQV